jgi:outer membrane protein TolC
MKYLKHPKHSLLSSLIQFGVCFAGGFTVSFTVSFAKAESVQTLSLNDYMKLVETQNLTVAASQASYEAAEARAVGIRLPPPKIGLSQMHDPYGSANGFSLSQTVPFPSKLSGDYEARNFESQMERMNSLSVKSETLAKARLLYIST